MSMATAKLCLLAAVTCVIAGPAVAQTAADELPPALRACADEVDVMRRLSCFDREMAKLQNTPTSEAEAPADGMPAAMPAEPAPATTPPVAPSPSELPAARAPAPVVAPGPATDVSDSALVDAKPAAPARSRAPEAAAPSAMSAREPAAVAAETAPSAPVNDDDFGAKSDEVREMHATVTGIRTRPYGELIIQLDNGQIWEQKHLDRRFRLEVGEPVTISRGLISGYRLSGRSNDSIQVERLK